MEHNSYLGRHHHHPATGLLRISFPPSPVAPQKTPTTCFELQFAQVTLPVRKPVQVQVWGRTGSVAAVLARRVAVGAVLRRLQRRLRLVGLPQPRRHVAAVPAGDRATHRPNRQAPTAARVTCPAHALIPAGQSKDGRKRAGAWPTQGRRRKRPLRACALKPPLQRTLRDAVAGPAEGDLSRDLGLSHACMRAHSPRLGRQAQPRLPSALRRAARRARACARGRPTLPPAAASSAAAGTR